MKTKTARDIVNKFAIDYAESRNWLHRIDLVDKILKDLRRLAVPVEKNKVIKGWKPLYAQGYNDCRKEILAIFK